MMPLVMVLIGRYYYKDRLSTWQKMAAILAMAGVVHELFRLDGLSWATLLVCLGYPFHAAGKPEKPRVEHLAALRTPTLIVQGERDALGSRERVAGFSLSPAIRLVAPTGKDASGSLSMEATARTQLIRTFASH